MVRRVRARVWVCVDVCCAVRAVALSAPSPLPITSATALRVSLLPMLSGEMSSVLSVLMRDEAHVPTLGTTALFDVAYRRWLRQVRVCVCA
jgi:hypothetical protein